MWCGMEKLVCLCHSSSTHSSGPSVTTLNIVFSVANFICLAQY
jgi:hypothetical protein